MRKIYAAVAKFKKTAFAFLAVLFCLMKIETGFTQTTITINCTGTAGSYNSGYVTSGGTKSIGNLQVIGNGSLRRGWAGFDLSSIPSGSTINSATLKFYVFSTNLSGVANDIYGFTGDPATMNGGTLYNNCGGASSATFINSTWSLNANSLNLNAQGISFIQNNLVNNFFIGFLRGNATAIYDIYGYPGSSAQQPQLVINYTPPAYLAKFTSLDVTVGGTKSATSWCAGETRNVLVTIKNAGASAWTSGGTGVNLSYWWTPGQNRDFNPRVLPFANLLPNASQTISIPITAPASGPLVLNFDLVKETFCWFADNVAGCSGPGNSVFVSPSITINSLPAITSQSTPTQTRCQGVAAAAMSVTAIGTGLTYQWYSNTTPSNSGGTIVGGATSASFTPPTVTAGTLYYYCVVSGTCTPAATSAVSGAIIVNPLPVAAGTITGTTPVCQGQNGVAYSVPAITNATGYVWTLPTGTTIATGANTNSITVNYSATATSGNITVYGTNACGNGTVSANYTVTVNPLPVAAGTITGTTPVCQGQNGVAYSVPATTNATGYVWTLPTGASIATGSNTRSITVNYSVTATSGNVSVYGTNACGNGTVSANFAVTVNPLPIAAGTITGSAAVCQGQNTVSYTVPAITNATSYTWAYSGTGATISGNTNPVSINFSATATSGNLTVTGTNSCGNGTVSVNFAVTVNPLPVAAGAITGTTPVCQGQNGVSYSVPAITNATSYTWAYSGTGATISGNTNPVTINFSATATSGNLTVTGTNSCGNGTVSANFAVTVNPLPVAAGAITGTTPVCQGQTGVTYSVPAITNATSYIWAYTGTGATITGTGNSVAIDFSTSATSGNLTVTGTNGCGSGTVSATYPILVNQPPIITTDPGPLTQTACASSNVSYTVVASGSGPLTYQWKLNGNPVVNGGRISGATTSTLTITGVTIADAGDYTVVVSGLSPCTSATSASATLVVDQRIVFTAQPITPQTICEGQPYTIFVQATGTVAISQWYYNGNPYTTNAGTFDGIDKYTLTIPNVAITDAGSYRLLLDDGSGIGCTAANSNIATLVVKPTPTATISGTTTVCQSSSPAPLITFTNPNALPVTITYNINSGANTTKNVAANSTATVAAPTTIAGTFDYNLVSVAYQSGPGCSNNITGLATVIVNPTPDASATPSAQTICSADAITTIAFMGSVPTTTFNWTRNNTGVTGIAASGSGDISGSLTNATNAPITVTFTITPTASSCVGAAITATVLVNPTSAVTSVTDKSVCNNGTVAAINFSSPTTGGTIVYNWTNNTTSIGLAASGIGNIAAFTGTNAGTSPVTATITVTPSYTNGGITCTGTSTTFTITVNPTATVNTVSDQTVCKGAATTAVTFSTPTTGGTIVYNWTNNTTSIGLPASGAGNIASFTAANVTTAPVTATITVTPSYTNGATCTGTPITFTITVNPAATVTTVSNQTVCNNGSVAAINFTSPTTGGTIVYNWTNNAASIGLAASGSGDIASFTGTNAGTAPVTATITVTPSYTNGTTCPGTAKTFTITVNPTATVNTVSSQTVCKGAATTAVTFSTPTTGGTIVYNWTNNTPSIGLAGSGAGNIASFTAANVTSAPVTATITVTPSYTNGATCTGTPITFTITVNPTSTVTAVPNQIVCNNAATTAVTFSSPTSGGTIVYNWTNNTPSIGLAASGAGDIASFTATNSGTAPITATITVTPTYTNGSTCSGTPTTFTITVNPTATVTAVTNKTGCNNGTANAITFTSPTTGGSIVYNWTNNTPSIGLAASGTGSIAAFTATNAGTSPVTATITVTPSYTNGGTTCTGTPMAFTITVNPTATVNTVPNQTVCKSAATTAVAFSSPTTGGSIVYNWTNNTPSIGLAASSSGNIAPFTALNAGSAPITATITVTPSYSNGATCPGTPITFTITVNPAATVTGYSNQTVCNNGTVAAENFSSPTSGGSIVYNWTNNTPSIGLAGSGIGNIASFTGTNAGTAPVTATITVTPSYTNGGTTCTGTPSTFTITVNPTANAIATPASQTKCSGIAITTIVLSSNATPAASVSYAWTRDNTATVTGIAASGSGNISGTLTNTTATAITVTFTITPTYTGGCTGTPTTATVLVNPKPTAGAITGPSTVCIGSTITLTPAGTGIGTLTYAWSSSTPSVASVNASTGVVTGAGVGTTSITYTVTDVNGCSSATSPAFTVTVTRPIANTITTIANPANTVCANGTLQLISNGLGTGTLSYTWTSSNTAKATVSNTGLVTGVATGTTNITYTVTDGNGCSAMSPAYAITVLGIPTGSIAVTENSGTTPNDNNICLGDAATFTFSTAGLGSYIFKINGVTKQTGISNVFSTSLLTGGETVTVDVANGNNCGATFTAPAVTVNPLPAPTLTVTENSGTANDKVICPNSPVTLTATPANATSTYSFIVGGTVVSTGTSNNYTVNNITANTTVAVMETNSSGCQTTTANQNITVSPVPSGTLTSVPSTTASSATICFGDNITFTATAGVGNTYNFKVNGNSVQGPSASNTFTTNTLTNPSVVKVDVTNASGCTTTFNAIAVTVNPLPTGTLTATENSNIVNDGIICANSPVTFTATSGYNNYAFYLNGTGTALYNGPSNIYTTSTLADNDYLTVLVTSGSNCAAPFTSASITVVPSPVGTLSASPSNTICAGDNVTFTATPDPTFTNYLFKLNGTTILQNGLGNTFSTTGLLQGDIVSVDVTNTNTCVTTFNSFTMTVNPLPTGTLTAVENSGIMADDGIICTGASIVFTAPAGFSNYNFIKNNISVQSGSSRIYTPVSLMSGDQVTVALTSGNCIGLTNMVTVTINPLPPISAITGTLSTCISGTTTLSDGTTGGTWTSANTSIATVNSTTGVVTGVAAGTVNILYTTAANSNGCTNSTSAAFTVNAPPTVAPITGNFNICTGLTSQLSDATTTGTFTWTSSNMGVATVDATGLVTGVTAGTATISYMFTDANGCSTTVSATVTVSAFPSVPPITAANAPPFNVCIGSTIALADATAGGTWSSSNTAVATVTASGVVTGLTSGISDITYSVTTSCGQNATALQRITVNAPPSATIDYGVNPYCTNGGPITVVMQTGTTGGTYSISGGLSINTTNGTITPGITGGTYTVTYTIPASGGCGVYTTTAPVTITTAPTITSFSYSGTPYCSTVPSASPSLVASSTSGTYSYTVTSGGPTLSLNATNGIISPSTSSAGTYTVTYTITASSGCAAISQTTSVTITATPTGNISYAGSPFCKSAAPVTVNRTAPAGGTYSYTGAGTLSINSGTGTITPSSSTAGTYTVTYTVAASGGCSVYTTTTSVTINPLPTATISGTSSVCQNGTSSVTFTGANGTAPYTFTYNINGSGTFTVTSVGNVATVNPPTNMTGTFTYNLVSVKDASATTCSQNQSGSATVTVVTPIAVPAITATPSSICLGNTGILAIASGSTTNLISENFQGTNTFSVVNTGTNIAASAWINKTSTYTYFYGFLGLQSVSFNSGSKFMLANSDAGGGATNTALVSPSVNTMGYSALTLSYRTYFRLSGGETAVVEVSTNGGTSWTTAQALTSTTGSSGNFSTQTVNLSSYINNNSVIIRFRYSGNNEWWWAIDDVVLSAASPLYSFSWAASPAANAGLPSGAGTPSPSNTSIVINPTATGSFIYTASLTNAGCTTTRPITVNVNPLPTVSITADYCVVAGKVRLTANGTSGVTYSWLPGGATTQSIDVDVAGDYDVTASFGAPTFCSATATISVANELVVNGDFEAGNTGFTSEYGYTADILGNTELYPEGLYGVGTSGQNYHDQFYGKDHTTTAQTGNFMLVNGSTTLIGSPARQRIIWEETVSVLPNTPYYFSAWGMNLNPASPARLQFEVNGVAVGTIADLNIAPKPNSNGTVNINNWVRFYSNPTWTSGPTTTTAVIRIINLNTVAGGNDFGLDDISFGTLSTFITLESAPGTDAQTPCINTAITPIVYSVGSSASAPTITPALPAGLTSSFNGIFFTISGTPTIASNYAYTITTTGSCQPSTASGTINVQTQTITLTSGSNAPVCINTTLPGTVYTVGGTATGASITAGALPTGVNGVYDVPTKTFNITGTPMVAGVFNYTITTTGSCTPATINGTITVTQQTITLNSANNIQTTCINSAITNIQYTIGGTGSGVVLPVTGLPAGVSGSYNSGILFISGTPTASGTFNYIVTTSGTCAPVTATGTITVTPNGSFTLTSGAGTNVQTNCINTAINSITYTLNNATGYTITGLPAGVSGSAVSGGNFSISGTPTAPAGTYNYTVTTTGGCGAGTASGTITVQSQTITLTSGSTSPTVCINQSMTPIVYNIGGTATGASISGQPAGVNGILSGNTFTISGTPTVAGPFNYTVILSGSCATTVTATGTITVTGAAIGGTLTSVSTCNGPAGTLTLSGQTGTIAGWEYSTNNGATWTAIANTTISQSYPALTSGTSYRVVVSNGCGNVFSSIATVGIHNLWTGITSTDWNTASNWSDYQVPSTSCPVVTIPVVPTNRYPILSTGAAATIIGLDIKAGASLAITGNTIQIAGAITNAGTFNATNGTVEFNGGGTQTVAAGTFMNNAIHDLVISNSAGVAILGATDIYGSVTYGKNGAVFNTNGFLTLKSTATETASLGDMTSHTINGDVTVERYIGVGNLHPKSWQLLAIPTSGGQTINQAWQDTATSSNQNRYPGYGTQITGATGTAGGFDLPVTATPSMKTWVPGALTYVGVSGTGISIYNQKGYFIFVRGDRSVTAFNIIATTPTVMRTKGPLFTPANPPPITNVGNTQFESVGNPYASEIDLRNISLSGGVTEFIQVWDPYLGSGATSPYGLGGFVTLSYAAGNYTATPQSPKYGAGPHNYIESGQAFFVQATGGNGTVSFDESAKVSGSLLVNSPVRNPQIVQQLRTNLYGVNPDGSGFMTDGTLNQFSSNYSNGIDGKDARKNTNTSENLSIKASGSLLAIERRQMVNQQDTIFLNLTGVRAQPYRYEFIAQNMNVQGLQGFVEDTYLHTSTPMDLNGTTLIDFTIVNIPGSYAANRFRIVFTQANVLPVTFTEVKAYKKDKNINVEWKVENELNIKDYTVEKSGDGVHFTTMTTTAATGSGASTVSYNALDDHPVTGYNYYRIRSNDQDGKISLTRVVKVLMGTVKQDINIYPNPITDGMIHLQFMNEPAGKYLLRLMNKAGQVILTRAVTRMDGNSTELIKWDYNLAHGMYQLEVTQPDGSVKNINVLY